MIKPSAMWWMDLTGGTLLEARAPLAYALKSVEAGKCEGIDVVSKATCQIANMAQAWSTFVRDLKPMTPSTKWNSQNCLVDLASTQYFHQTKLYFVSTHFSILEQM